MSSVTAIVLAAGQGTRMKSAVPKQYLAVGGRPVLLHSLQLMEESSAVQHVVLVVGSRDVDPVQEMLAPYALTKLHQVVPGGKERSHSVYHGLKALPEDCAWVVVHDGVRPFFTLTLLERVIRAAKTCGAAIPGVPVKDTIKVCDEQGLVVTTPPRQSLWAVQTPQAFRRDWLVEAYEKAMEDGITATDDAGLVERLGRPVQVVQGEYTNIKITTPEDLALAELIWERRQQDARGHRF
ncbi:MAG TPA: 2-C-methyl-D-erythritol 4-phosphate cytidylyltransferase [Clostridia bacterium]|nr:2-C-methyl-D-erythritol 4-phosphate cytidylyltransferase [Clostridia bacterium]